MYKPPPASAPLGSFAKIALAIPVRSLFDYRVPAELHDRVLPGVRVRVPFRSRTRIGYCIERVVDAEHPDPLPVQAVLDEEPILGPHLLELARWTARYYLSSLGEVIEAAIPKSVRGERTRTERWVRLPGGPGEASEPRSPAQRRVLAALQGSEGGLSLKRLLRTAGVSESPVKTLVRRGELEVFSAPARPPQLSPPEIPSPSVPPLLNQDQQRALWSVLPTIEACRFEVFLLHGVTGSGKTEVYLRVIEAVLRRQRGALVLLPEIALTPQTVARFRERLGEVAVLHSLLPGGERAHAYRQLREGSLRLAIGARSAVFAPIRNLGVIVVDECHESSYKQESTPRYHARDLAIVRASQLGIPCILGSATPSLETLHNVQRGRYQRLSLPERVTANSLATVEIVDRRREVPDRRGALPVFSPRLMDLLAETLAGGEQAILFLNRRGFARNIHCPRCGFFLRCESCDIGLTYHRRAGHSLCHYCGGVRPFPDTCPECHYRGIRRSRPGTERIEDILNRRFPGTRVDRLDRDTATSRDRMEDILERFRSGDTQVLVGTQMVAKGHDIPGVTLVGVVDADLALNLPDFRAAERTTQLICQVAGRAGRGDRPGRVIIQTHHPEHYAIEAARRQDVDHLIAHEASARRALGYPPYGYLVRVLCEDPDEERAVASARTIREEIPAQGNVMILGPAPAPLARLRRYYRFHMLLKGKEREPLHRAARHLTTVRPRWSTTRVTIDVDPQNLL